MSTVFEVPCPECGREMSVADRGELKCGPCGRTYHVRMGHLFPVGEPLGGKAVISEGPPGVGRPDRPTVATP
jgi:ribosomal protein S27E